MTEAENSLKKKEFIRARYLYKQAFRGFAASGDLDKAITCGTQTSYLFRREYLYKEAFAMCWEVDQLINVNEQQQKKQLPDAYFHVAQERFKLYSQLRNKQKVLETLQKMEALVNQAKSTQLQKLLEKNKIQYTFTFSSLDDSMNSLRPLLDKHKQDKAWDSIENLYEEMADLAETLGNQALSTRLKTDLSLFEDSLSQAKTMEEVKIVNDQLLASQQQVQEQADDLQMKSYHIMGLYGLAAVLAAVIVVLIFITLLYIRKAKVIQTRMDGVNELNRLKSETIKKVSILLTPAFDRLENSIRSLPANSRETSNLHAQAEALSNFNRDLQTMVDMENSITELYEQSEFYVDSFCKEIEEEISSSLKTGVVFQLDTPHMMMKTNPEELKTILLHLISNATRYTTSGKIVLTFKKRSARTVQLHLMDTGCGIPEERRENIFTPFATPQTLTEGSGLGLPICALRVQKLNGTLSLDANYKKGALFVIEIHS